MRDVDLEYYEGLLREIGEIVATGLRRPGGVAQARPSPTAEDIYACCQSTLIGFRDELTEQQIKFICDQIARKSTLPSTPSEPAQAEAKPDDGPLRRAAWAQLNILDHWGAAPEGSAHVSCVIFQNAAFTIRKLVDALPSVSSTNLGGEA